MADKEYRYLPRTGEHYEPPPGKICACKGCFRTIPVEMRLCTACSECYHGPGGKHGYNQGGETT